MKTNDALSLTVVVAVAGSLLIVNGAGVALAGYVDEVQSDAPYMWYRMDEAAGETIAVDSGEFMNDGVYTDVELEVPGLIATDPGSTAARFDGFSSELTLTNFDGYNLGGPWEEKSVVLWFQADDPDTDEEQVIFDQGGTTRGLNVYVVGGEVVVGAWNRAPGDGGGVDSPWPTDNAGMEITLVSAPITAGETYQVALVMDGETGGFGGTLTGYLNGQAVGQEGGVGLLYAHSNTGSIGSKASQTAFPGINAVAADPPAYFAGVIDEVALYNTALSADRILAQYTAAGGAGGTAPLQAGDANQDYEFNQLDLVQVQVAAKYLTGAAATWGEGDWDGAPGGEPGSPPAGNGTFDQIDVIAALGAGTYLTGPYAAISKGGVEGDGQTSIVYDAGTGEVRVDAPSGVELTSVNIDSAASIFTGEPAQNLGGSFDNDADGNIFKATFGSSFGSLSFGNVAQAGLSEDFVANDLTVIGSLNGGGDLGAVDLIYIPEPSSLVLLGMALATMLSFRIRL